MKRALTYLHRLYTAVRWHGMFVIVDGADNSVTFSKRLAMHIGVWQLETCKVWTFVITNLVSADNRKQYAFMPDPPLDPKETYLSDIQFNGQHQCIGYECLIPTVNRILYDYDLPAGKAAKLRVIPVRVFAGDKKRTAYKILRHDHNPLSITPS